MIVLRGLGRAAVLGAIVAFGLGREPTQQTVATTGCNLVTRGLARAPFGGTLPCSGLTKPGASVPEEPEIAPSAEGGGGISDARRRRQLPIDHYIALNDDDEILAVVMAFLNVTHPPNS